MFSWANLLIVNIITKFFSFCNTFVRTFILVPFYYIRKYKIFLIKFYVLLTKTKLSNILHNILGGFQTEYLVATKNVLFSMREVVRRDGQGLCQRIIKLL